MTFYYTLFKVSVPTESTPPGYISTLVEKILSLRKLFPSKEKPSSLTNKPKSMQEMSAGDKPKLVEEIMLGKGFGAEAIPGWFHCVNQKYQTTT